MRNLLLLGLAVGGAFMAGWFTIERDGDRTRIEINKNEIRSDARQAIDRGRQYIDQREQERVAAQQEMSGGAWPQQSQFPQSGGFSQTQPGFAPPQPGFNQPQPGFGQTQPNFGQSQPGFGQPQPNYGFPNQQTPGSTAFPDPNGFNTNFPAPSSTPRYSQSPPPWQQQTR